MQLLTPYYIKKIFVCLFLCRRMFHFLKLTADFLQLSHEQHIQRNFSLICGKGWNGKSLIKSTSAMEAFLNAFMHVKEFLTKKQNHLP